MKLVERFNITKAEERKLLYIEKDIKTITAGDNTGSEIEYFRRVMEELGIKQDEHVTRQQVNDAEYYKKNKTRSRHFD